MLKIARLLRDYRDAGSVNSLLAPWAFVDDHTFLTKAGHVGRVCRLKGVDYEGLTHPQRAALTHRFEAALRLHDEHYRIYQYLMKRVIDPIASTPCAQPVAQAAIQERAAYLNECRSQLYDLELYLVIVYEAPTAARTSTQLQDFWRAPTRALRSWLSMRDTLRLLETELDRAIATLHHKAEAVQVQMSDFGLEWLRKADAFRFLRTLVNYDAATIDAARLNYDTHLDYFIADSAVECHRDHLLVGHQRV